MGTIQEVGVKFTMTVDNMLKNFGLLEKQFDNLPQAAEKATNKMNTAFNESTTSIKKFDDLLAKSGKDFDTKAVQTELQKAQKEFSETGKVNKETMQSLQKEIKNVDWKSLDLESRQTFKNVIANVDSLERNMKKLDNVKLLEDLPADAKTAGKHIIDLEHDLDSLSKKMKNSDSDADFSNLNKGLGKAKAELKETGKVSDSVMNSINNDIKSIDFDKIPVSASVAFGKVEERVDQLNRNLKSIGKDVDISAPTKGLSKDIDASTGAVGGLKGAFKTLGPVVGGALAAVSVVDFTKQIIDATAEVKALNSQYEQVMGDMKGTTDKYLGEISEKYNVHPNELKKSMLQYQAILKSKGLSEKDAYETSKMWLERTVDGSSFANESMEESTARMMGIIKGEYDSADTVMINLSQTMLNDKAQEEYGKKWEQLTVKQQENLKVQESIRQHNKAGVMGQGIKEADSYEKNLARLKNTWTDFLASYGGPALNVANQGLKGAVKLIQLVGSTFDFVGKKVKLVKDAIAGLFSSDKEKGADLLKKLGLSQTQIKALQQGVDALKSVKDKVSEFFKGYRLLFFNDGSKGREILKGLGLSPEIINALDNFALKFSQFKAKIKGFIDGFKLLFVDDGAKGRDILRGIGLSEGTIKALDDIVLKFLDFKRKIIGFKDGFKLLFKDDGAQGREILKGLGFSPDTIKKLDDFAIKISDFKRKFTGFKDGFMLLFKDDGEQGRNILKGLGFSPETIKKLDDFALKFSQFKANIKNLRDGIVNILAGNSKQGIDLLKQMGLSQDKINLIKNSIDTIKNTFTSLKNTLGKVFSEIGKFIGSELKKNFGFLISEGPSIFKAFGNIVKMQMGIVTIALKSIGNVVKIQMGIAATAFKLVFPVIKLLGTIIGAVMMGVWKVMQFVWPAVKMLIVSVWNNIKGVISGGLQVIRGVIKVFTGLFTGDFKKMWSGIKDIFFGAIKFIWNYVQLMFYGKLLKGALGFAKLFAGGLKSMWGTIVGFFKSSGSTLLKNTISIFTNIWKSVSRIFGNLVKWLINANRNMVNGLVNLFKSLWTNAVKIFESLRSGLSKIWSSIRETAYNAGKFIFDKVTDFFKSMWTSSIKLITNLKDGLFNAWKIIKQNAYDAGKFVKDKIVGFMQDTWNGVSRWIDSIKSGFVNLKDNVISTVKGLADGIKNKLEVGVNLVIDGVNWVADKLGVGSKLNHVHWSTGTPGRKPNPNGGGSGGNGGHPGGFATVADKGPGNGKGVRELVQFPNGKMALFEQETTFMMPEGTHVWSNKETEPILESVGYSTGTKKAGGKNDNGWMKAAFDVGFDGYKRATGVFGVKNTNKALKGMADAGEKIQELAEYATNPGKLVDLVLSKFGVNFDGFKGMPAELIGGMYNNIKKGMKDKFTKWFDETGGDGRATAGILDPNMISYFFGHTAAYTSATGRYWHEGVDFPFVYQPVKTPMGGVLTRQGFMNNGYGNWVTVDSGNTRLIFGHLNDYSLSPPSGTRVKPGQVVGKTGNTGFSTGPHLHFGVKLSGVDVNPEPWLRNAKPRKAYADGGIITSPHVGLVGEDGNESIIPHDPAKRDRANRLLSITDRIVNPKKYASGTPKAKTHTVRWGDTLWGISMANKLTVETLKKLNNLKSNLILPGQVLKLTNAINNLNKTSKTGANKVFASSRTDKLIALADSLITRASKNPKAKTYKNDLAIGNLIKTNMKNIGSQSLETIQKNIGAIVSKIDSVVKAATTKVSDLKVKIRNSGDAKVIKSAKDELRQYEEQIKALKKLKENEVLKQAFMSRLYKQREELLVKMKELQEKEAQLKENKVSFKQSMSENLMGYAGFGAAKGNTARDFVEFMKYRLGKVKKFSSNISKLKSMGLDPEIIQEMVSGGIESAMPRAEVLIAGGTGYIRQINALQAQVKKEIESITTSQANNLYDPQIANVKAKIIRNDRRQKELSKEGQTYLTTKIKPKVSKTSKPATRKVTKITSKNHRIVWGDTLSGIAQRYGTTVAELKKFNGLKSDLIIAGRTLKIPIRTEVVEIISHSTKTVGSKSSPKASNKTTKTAKTIATYIVKAGDSLGLIAQKYRTTVAKLMSANGLRSTLIHPNQKLKIPGYASGGIIDIPQLAWIAEGGFAESIISHDPSKRVQQQRIWKETGDKLGFDSMNSEQLQQMIKLMEQQLKVQGVIANKESVIQMDSRIVGKEVAPHVQDEIVKQQRLSNRGLANGR